MSNISTRHNVLAFIAGKSEPLSGQRLAKCGYKKTAAMPNPPTSICVSLPYLTDAALLENASRLLPMLRECVQDTQDKIIRALYESRGASLDSFTSVSDNEVSIDAIVAFNESESSGGRITKEYLEQWFADNMADSLTVAIADKVGATDIDDARVSQALAGYKGLFASLSGTKTILGEGQIVQLRRVLELCGIGAEDRIGAWAVNRLAEMDKKNANLTALF